MRKVLIFWVAALFMVACQNGNKQNNEETGKSSVTINYETESGIPEFSATSDEAVKLQYYFTEGDSAHMIMETEMNMEMMGQKMPMQMTMESNYKINEVTENGNAKIGVEFTRVAVSMDGPQPMKFDSDSEEDMENNPSAGVFTSLLNNEISSEITPSGKVVEMNMDAIMDNLPAEQGAQVKGQLESMSDQFAQNAFVALPDEPVKEGDVYDAGIIETGNSGMSMKVDMKYKVLSISEDKRYVILEPQGEFIMESIQEGVEMSAEDNTIGGWVLFDLERGFLESSDMKMFMKLTANQMAIKMDMNIKMRME
ncbi:MAG TPA: DUF6263 family protein [Salinivirga sp.]|uniref:DUF6263 family protein n=1 Tax=Salinivirga sp. TaxID=1970192 RepID=UPI002B490FB2|nr:DUF6263 family protein [Salinivirga sp.]HKK58397.1 DUF6263 family protein [Salinivirga sp.]